MLLGLKLYPGGNAGALMPHLHRDGSLIPTRTCRFPGQPQASEGTAGRAGVEGF